MSCDEVDIDISEIEATLGYAFTDQMLLVNALTRRSFWHEHRETCSANNERMEFLGDAVLGLVIADILYQEFPDDEEGHLQKKRASLVNRAALARLMKQLDLARFIRMGKGDEISGCRSRASILADTLEAIVAAVYLDGGLPEAARMIQRHFYPLIERCSTREGTDDYRSALQQKTQAELGVTPDYRLLDQWGDDHEKQFTVAVFLTHQMVGWGTGKNKREAAQNAARDALERMGAADWC